MLVTLDTFRPLPTEFRTSFELPGWPYHPDARKSFDRYMKSLTVFRYYDSCQEENGKNRNFPINYAVTDRIERGRVCYWSQVHVHTDPSLPDDQLYRVMAWPADEEYQPLLKKVREDKVAMDMAGWVRWNVPYKLEMWTDQFIKRDVIKDAVKSLVAREENHVAEEGPRAGAVKAGDIAREDIIAKAKEHMARLKEKRFNNGRDQRPRR